MKTLSSVFTFTLVVLLFSSCFNSKMMENGRVQVNFDRNDVVLSGQVSGEATQTRILGVDWSRLFKRNVGETSSRPFFYLPPFMGANPFGFVVHNWRTMNYAMYELMNNNPGYDFILNPQYEIAKKGFDPIYSKITVKATAQLGKYK